MIPSWVYSSQTFGRLRTLPHYELTANRTIVALCSRSAATTKSGRQTSRANSFHDLGAGLARVEDARLRKLSSVAMAGKCDC